MAVSLNKVLLVGNLTRDPVVKFIGADNNAVANFGLAVNRRWKGNDGQMKEETTFVDVETWGRTAELAGQYLVKGRPVFVEGRLKLDTWDDKDGTKRQKLKVVADSIQFMDSGKRDGQAAAPADGSAPAAPASAGEKPAPTGDEPPF